MLIIQLIFCLTLFQQNPNQISEKQLLGSWEHTDYKQNIQNYKKTKKTDQNKNILSFAEGGILVLRTGADQCGTPPIMYHNISGRWKLEKDILEIKYSNWRGLNSEYFQVLSVDGQKLSLKRVPAR